MGNAIDIEKFERDLKVRVKATTALLLNWGDLWNESESEKY